MITDALLQLSSAQAVTATAVSTNSIDTSTLRDAGGGEQVLVAVTVDVSAAAAGAATVTFQIVGSASGTLSSPTVLAQTDAIGKAELTAGRRPILLAVPRAVLMAQPFGQRYLGVQYTVGTGPLTAGAFTATIVRDGQVGPSTLYARGQAIY